MRHVAQLYFNTIFSFSAFHLYLLIYVTRIYLAGNNVTFCQLHSSVSSSDGKSWSRITRDLLSLKFGTVYIFSTYLSLYETVGSHLPSTWRSVLHSFLPSVLPERLWVVRVRLVTKTTSKSYVFFYFCGLQFLCHPSLSNSDVYNIPPTFNRDRMCLKMSRSVPFKS